MRKYPILILTALLGVTACAHHKNADTSGNIKTGDVPVIGKALNSSMGMQDQRMARLSTAANNAIAEGRTKEALVYYSKLYNENQKPDNALNYAQLLRKTGQAEDAVKILSPFVNGRDGEIKGSAKPVMLNEYAAANIELGKYDLAEEALNKVLEDNKATAFHPDADNLLGLILDARNRHKEAEQYYRQALDSWKGDPSAVMNNLGLCLAAQGMLDQSLMVLHQALVKAPHNEEIARNIQMVDNLRKSLVPTAPISVTSPPKAH
jgi:Flp pilus assembly protein TadD